MELSTAIVIAAFVACPIAMGAAMWLMNRRMNEPRLRSQSGSAADRLAELRAQREQLEAEIAEVGRLLDLEAKAGTLREKTEVKPGARLQAPRAEAARE